MADLFLKAVRLKRDGVSSPRSAARGRLFKEYPFTIPSIRDLDELAFSSSVTFFIGENGTGKSTLLEALAVAAGFNAEGGSRNFRFATKVVQWGIDQPPDPEDLPSTSTSRVAT